MNRKELGFIRRQLRTDSQRLRVRTLVRAYCRADEGGKSIIALNIEPFEDLIEEDRQVYLASAKKALSGKQGKNLLEIPVENREVIDSWKKLVGTSWNEETVTPLVERMMEPCAFEGPFYIHLYQCELNASARADETETHSFVLITVHPTKPLSEYIYYDSGMDSIRRHVPGDLQLDPSVSCAILYPVLEEEGSNWSDVLWKTGKDGTINEALLDVLFEAEPVLNASEQNQAVQNIIESVCGDDLDLSVIQKLRKQVDYMNSTSDSETEEPSLDETDMEVILKACGIEEQKLENLSEVFEKEMKNERIRASSIFSTPKMNLTMNGISVSVSQDAIHRIRRENQNGRDVLVIDLEGDLEADHFPISPGGTKR